MFFTEGQTGLLDALLDGNPNTCESTTILKENLEATTTQATTVTIVKDINTDQVTVKVQYQNTVNCKSANIV